MLSFFNVCITSIHAMLVLTSNANCDNIYITYRPMLILLKYPDSKDDNDDDSTLNQ